MSGRRILITGGAGFIGSHLADHLLARGDQVRALDVLSPQVHGEGARRPAYLDEAVELLVGDVRDPDMVRRALRGVDAVVHLAAAEGVGQSMYEVERYVAVNGLGTAVLLQALMQTPVERLVVASSMCLYGEGLYRDGDGRIVPADRTREQLLARRWEPLGPGGEALHPVPTPESKVPSLASIYGLSKLDQERMCLLVGEAYGIPTTALRLFNVYGTRQALSNPYTGVLAIFAARLLNGRPPLVHEDGLQRRDFVSVHDVVRACRLALDAGAAAGEVLNVGSGRSASVLEVARKLARALGRGEVEPEVTGRWRVGDVRHCFADVSRARSVLGYEPEVTFDEGLAELGAWLEGQSAHDRVLEASAELSARGLSL
jgi:dTDP-L-rhamnose 4-epimerase